MDPKDSDYDGFRLRSYQVEMVDLSMKRNIIVAMDTGSGKTAIAVARTQAALERNDAEKRVWFLAPTVPLCHQQFRVFQRRLPGYQSLLITGNDDYDKWTDQSTWDTVLSSIRIVLSTHQVLLDALSHGFVKMQSLSLLIFDEAHHCTRKHPGNLILQNFYIAHAENGARLTRPSILGLTASPVMRAKASPVKELEKLEGNMNAKVAVPRLHRTELLSFVHRPKLRPVTYQTHSTDSFDAEVSKSGLFQALDAAYLEYDITNDPYIKFLQSQNGDGTAERVRKTIVARKTFCLKQLRLLCTRAGVIRKELGIWAAEWFIRFCVQRFLNKMENQYILGTDMTVPEARHLAEVLFRLPTITDISYKDQSILPGDEPYISSKVKSLLDLLSAKRSPDLTGLIFVEQRASVFALTQLLRQHSVLRSSYKVAPFVGMSGYVKNNCDITELADQKDQDTSLKAFDAGDINLIVCTNVLEEGIDVPNCHVVICFDPPKNLKSFIQRRGRARKEESEYILFLPTEDAFANPTKWQSLEGILQAAYEDDLRAVKEAEERENEHEGGSLSFRVASTGALLTLDNAVSHLNHFCATLGTGKYVDHRPQFSFQEDGYDDLVTAEVILPIVLPPEVRVARSGRPWRTERSARKDAAFQAYLALYQKGLVNDNLLPAAKHLEEDFQVSQGIGMSGFTTCKPRKNMLTKLANMVNDWNNGQWYQYLIEVDNGTDDSTSIFMLSPLELPQVPNFDLHWSTNVSYNLKISGIRAQKYSEEQIRAAQRITHTLLGAAFFTVDKHRTDFPLLFIPFRYMYADWQRASQVLQGSKSAAAVRGEDLGSDTLQALIGLVRDNHGRGSRYIFKGLTNDSNNIVATKFPKKRDFLHLPQSSQELEHEEYMTEKVLEVGDCTVDNLPAAYAILSLFVPSIIRRVELAMLAEDLRSNILASVGFQDAHLVQTAITHDSAHEVENYQRLEFLGDCILKYMVSIMLMVEYPLWPEGHLTAMKGSMISNSYLSERCKAMGVDRYIITDAFKSTKWYPLYIRDLKKSAEENVMERSTKTLADVVEALVGAAYVDGGMPAAVRCMNIFLPTANNVFHVSIEDAARNLGTQTPAERDLRLESIEKLIGYSFNKESLLLEAITHPSFSSSHLANVRPYDRLEFLGDAVLEFIVDQRLYSYHPELTHVALHLLRSSVVNSGILSFLCFDFAVEETAYRLARTETGEFSIREERARRSLWQFMRHSSSAITTAQQVALEYYNFSKDEIKRALREDSYFPWSDLISFEHRSEKFFSDMIESIIGAIFVDSLGNIEACEQFLDRIGLFRILHRLIKDQVDCRHPKNLLGIIAISKTVNYEVERVKGSYSCSVKVGGWQVGLTIVRPSREEAETEAAKRAYEILKEENSLKTS